MADAPLTPEQMEALMDKVLGEHEADKRKEASPPDKRKEKVKGAIKAGAEQAGKGRGALGSGAQRQMDELEREGY